MLEDRYGNPISTTSNAARDAYVEGVDRFLAALPDVTDSFQTAIDADPDFALAYVGLARIHQVSGNAAEAQAAIAEARAHTEGLREREAGHVHALGLLVDGQVPKAYAAIRAHLIDYPTDVMLAQTCVSVFGLIGFSGLVGREAEQLAFTAGLLPHYGDDWWFLGVHGFAQAEVGQIGPATENLERSLAAHPRNATSAHIRAHIYYEAGDTDGGYDYMTNWWPDYGKGGTLHCHVSWHIAIWALERGDTETMWRVLDDHVAPAGAWGPALNVLTDMAAFLYRAELAGIDVPAERWRTISDFATEKFPNPGLAFADVHAALAHAKAGNSDALQKIITDAKGPAAGPVQTIAKAFGELARENWAGAAEQLAGVMAEHERIGGSRAQRDLLEYALLGALLKQGQTTEANRWIAARRPNKISAHGVVGL